MSQGETQVQQAQEERILKLTKGDLATLRNIIAVCWDSGAVKGFESRKTLLAFEAKVEECAKTLSTNGTTGTIGTAAKSARGES
jgi:hypothetical protein